MDSTNIELPGSMISAVDVDGETIAVRFAPAYLIKMMTGSAERTRWKQNGALVFDGAELVDDEPLPDLPAECLGGDVGENVYTYRDMVPVPLESRGRVHCVIKTAIGGIRISGTGLRLIMEDVPKYIEHLRPE